MKVPKYHYLIDFIYYPRAGFYYLKKIAVSHLKIDNKSIFSKIKNQIINNFRQFHNKFIEYKVNLLFSIKQVGRPILVFFL